jgi:DNA modification methylase
VKITLKVPCPDEPLSKQGQIYQLGKHRLMCGDSTSASDVEKLMNDTIAHISFTSPPYNVGHNLGYDNSSKYENDDDDKSNYVEFLKEFTNNAYNHSQYTFVNIQQLSNNKVDLIKWLYEFKHRLCDTIIWDKGHAAPAMAHKVMNSCFEYIYIFNESAKRTVGTKDFHGNIKNVVKIPSQRNNEYSNIHNATFPIELPTYIIQNFSNANETILDLFGGTGTTLIACEQLERTCYMMELDPKYVDVIIQRWEQFTGQKAVLLNE